MIYPGRTEHFRPASPASYSFLFGAYLNKD
ncbi:hypothetical protein SAMN05216193_103239 [Pseudomonas jinjuensis]|uniref:Uncharacterized protein n=1 Tax=Pseudomonas jinjuensis TaxID=198616 RepID=A0A1H0BY66_9PSED|nr:hypothetical protein SAMN05216193_103239 [Pseudomonas jinjuensis]